MWPSNNSSSSSNIKIRTYIVADRGVKSSTYPELAYVNVTNIAELCYNKRTARYYIFSSYHSTKCDHLPSHHFWRYRYCLKLKLSSPRSFILIFVTYYYNIKVSILFVVLTRFTNRYQT
jgi:hypothetical protein